MSSSSLGSPSEKNGASPRLSSLSDNKTTDLPIMPFGTRFFNFEIKFKSRRTFITLGLACALFSRSTKSLCQSSAALGRKKFNHLCTLHRGAFCQFPFRWIYYCHSSKFTGKETGKTHLCALVEFS